MEEIMKLAEEHSIYVVEDAAQAIGSTYTFLNGSTASAGTIGHIGCTSFFPSKNLGCFGDGGAIFTNDDAIAEEIRSIANHGMKVRYHHDKIGVNSRLDTIQAAVLRVKLKYLDEYNSARQIAAKRYDELFVPFTQFQTPYKVPWSKHCYHQYTIRLLKGDRHKLISNLTQKGIPAMVYYPIPLHRQKAFMPFVDLNVTRLYSNSIKLSETVFSLPMHTELDLETQEFIVHNVVNSL
jgi:dTDP-4-amino-4,6-dideoxygalactose transaminase